jgi:hypothetical protein
VFVFDRHGRGYYITGWLMRQVFVGGPATQIRQQKASLTT